MDDHAIIIVARLGKANGLRGWQSLQSFTSPSANVLKYSPWFVKTNDRSGWQELGDIEHRYHKDSLLVRLNKVTDRDAAQLLNGSFIGVAARALEALDEDEFYWHQLIGCKVVNRQGVNLGELIELFETGAHAVMSIKEAVVLPQSPPQQGDDQAQQPMDSKAHLVPFTAAYVINVDQLAKIIHVDWDADWT